MDEITLTDILYKYKDQQPKQFGEGFEEKCYPVSAIYSICEEYHQMMNEREQKESKQQSNCNLPNVSGALPLLITEKYDDYYLAYLKGINGMVVEAQSEDEAIDELMISIRVKLLHDRQ